MNEDDEQAPVVIPIDGCLDLHSFAPGELGELVPAYLEACREKGIAEVRIVHGKGIGNLRRSVHAILQRLPWVLEFRLAGSGRGAWGATLVLLEVTKP
jgi:DNA-nicking Smr family endonuclease